MRLRTTALLVTNAVLLSLLAGIVIGDRRAQAGTVPGTSSDEFPLVQDRTDAKNGDIITLVAPNRENNARHVLYIVDVRKRQLAAYQTFDGTDFKAGTGMQLIGTRDFRYDLFVPWLANAGDANRPVAVARSLSQELLQAAKDEKEADSAQQGRVRPGGAIVAIVAPTAEGNGGHLLYLIDVVKRQAAAYLTESDSGIRLVAARDFRTDLFHPWYRGNAGDSPAALHGQLPQPRRDAAAEERAVERGD